MQEYNGHTTARAGALRFEKTLSREKRKGLGQYFTGIKLGKLLSHVALSGNTRTVLDPMGGHGDLLDATLEAAQERAIKLEQLDGVEIDDGTAAACQRRLDEIVGKKAGPKHQVLRGSAFDAGILGKLTCATYDLVITNPPYVRYQALNGANGRPSDVRDDLLVALDKRLSGSDRSVWKALAAGYSGLADLSVPAWLLAASLVKPGGRLALVVPGTWRSRSYGDCIRYLLLRCFDLEYIVEDTQPGWFSSALVRTHLVVARRRTAKEIAITLHQRDTFPAARWVTIAPAAGSETSLVGSTFRGAFSEKQFARWLSSSAQSRSEIEVRNFDLRDEWESLKHLSSRRKWFTEVEPQQDEALPLFGSKLSSPKHFVPNALRSLLGAHNEIAPLESLSDAGITVGQGLRTGCNRFFYVEVTGRTRGTMVQVRASRDLGGRELHVPSSALLPVVRNQKDLSYVSKGDVPPGRVLVLRDWVLPEHAAMIQAATMTYRAFGESIPKTMPEELANYVRFASDASFDGKLRIPDLSAVRTNVREHKLGKVTPRCWYMLPDFRQRHLPQAFVARVNHGVPQTESNLVSPILIDANFSTFWSDDKTWTPMALKAVLNSTWCRLLMESVGTPLGGGALKLEAIQLSTLSVPIFTSEMRRLLEVEGRRLASNRVEAVERIDAILFQAIAPTDATEKTRPSVMADHVEKFRRKRQRTVI